ncbi:hypothetical protein [Streptomyces sp. NPDC002952]|uniref:hypothetical protein n=1 Tax=Streptomyces sp. NPDC002952 TaxID=3364673 RepID=UPI00368FDDC3
MANIVWHAKLRIHLDLTLEDLGHEEYPGLWDMVYGIDRMYAARDVPVAERDLRCGGVCQEAGVIAPMYLRMRDGRREAVHERREDDERHTVFVSDEHKAYQERILRAADEGGFCGDSEVRTRVGRSWIQTDTLIEGADGLRIGWEVQLSTAGTDGPRSVRSRAAKAEKNGITPAWHTDRANYANRHDTHWTRSNNLPAHVIAKNGDLRVISGFRKLDFWLCDIRAVHPCPNGVRRCGKHHATPVPKDVLFDDLVRNTAAGTIVPIQFRASTKLHRFWVTEADRSRYSDLLNDDTRLPELPETVRTPSRASQNRPTCQPDLTVTSAPASQPDAPTVTAAGLLPSQPAPPAAEMIGEPPCSRPPESNVSGSQQTMLLADLVALQQVSDREKQALSELHEHEERRQQRRIWFEAAQTSQDAVTRYARSKGLNRFEVERAVRAATKDAEHQSGPAEPPNESLSTDVAG